MDRAYIDTHNVVDRYVMDKLTESERAAFEIAFLQDERLQDEVQLAEAMQAGLRSAELRLKPDDGNAPAPGLLAWLFAPSAAVAYSVALLGMIGFLMSPYVVFKSGNNEERLRALSSDTLIQSMRGQEDDANSLIEVNTPALVRVDVGPFHAESYTATLLHEDRVVARLAELVPDDEFRVGVLVEAIEPGDYMLVVHKDEGGIDDRQAIKRRVRITP